MTVVGAPAHSEGCAMPTTLDGHTGANRSQQAAA